MSSKPLVSYPACTGLLIWNEGGNTHQIAIKFGVEVDQAGSIQFAIEDQPLTKQNFWVNIAFASESAKVAQLSLKASNAEKMNLVSDSVHLTAVRTPSTPNAVTLQFTAKAQRLTVYPEAGCHAEVQHYQAEYWIPGLRWFHGAKFSIAEGEVAIAGDVNPDDYAKVSGEISIRSSAHGRSADVWITEIDPAIHRVLDVVSFADGHFMRPTVRQVFADEKLVCIDYFGRRQGSSPYKPPLPCLNFTNSLPPLIQAYTPELVKRTGLSVAIEWHLMPHLYNEARFVSQMTAIEHLIYVFSEQSPDATYIDKRCFNVTIAPIVIEALKQELNKLSLPEDQALDALKGMSQSLKGINRRSLRSNLDRMIRLYRVPIEGLQDSIKPLIDTRNAIVHRGLSSRDDDSAALGQRVAEAEELLRRIIFALLLFRGRYTSWLNKVEDREFQVTP